MIKSRAAKTFRFGQSQVLYPPQSGLGFGNFLYLWLRTYELVRSGADVRVVVPDALEPWRKMFPALNDLSVSAHEVPRTRRRFFDWNSKYGVDFEPDVLNAFIADVLADGLGPNMTNTSRLAINIRRGNYYSVPHFRGTYSFDIASYVDVALELIDFSNIGSVLVISDDPDWCELKLRERLLECRVPISFMRDRTPQEQFGALCESGYIIGTNSTFSNWGGYVSTFLHDSPRNIIMPKFHARLGKTPWAYQLDPRWTVVDEIPGGWDA